MNAPVTTERATRERGIPFSGPMVRAILGGTKTQTRRIVKPQPAFRYPGTVRLVYDQHPMSPSGFVGTPAEGLVGGEDRMGWLAEDWCGNVVGAAEEHAFRCPYGVPGDRLYVREAWAAADRMYQDHDLDEPGVIAYRADLSARFQNPGRYTKPGPVPAYDLASWNFNALRWRPSIHMPRWASRITLEITGVRVERLQSITEADARAEGVVPFMGIGADQRIACDVAERTQGTHPHVVAFAALWDEINGEHASWAANPWVWVVSFRRVEG